jgi:hypothetical protein
MRRVELPIDTCAIVNPCFHPLRANALQSQLLVHSARLSGLYLEMQPPTENRQ